MPTTLPEGFILDKPEVSNKLPEGFILDKETKIPQIKPKETPQDIMTRYSSGQMNPKQSWAFEELKKRGFTDEQLSGVSLPLVASEPQPKPPEKEIFVPEWAKEHPSLFGAYGAGKAILEQVVTPSVETAGAVAGSIFSPIVGTSLGYAGAKQTMDIVEEAYAKLGGAKAKERTISGELIGSAKDVVATMVLGKGMEAIPAAKPALQKAHKLLFDELPKKLYASAIKLPTSKKWVKVLPGKEITKRTAAVEEGLRSKIPPSEFGMEKIKSLEKEVRKQVDEATSILSENPNIKIKIDDILQSGLKKAYGKAKVSSDPEGSKAIIDKIKEKFKAHGEFITPQNANDIKRTLYKEVHWGDTIDPITAVSKKGIAKDIMFKLEEIYPDLRQLNDIDAARIALLEGIEKSVGRQANKDIVSLGTKVMAVHPKAWPLAIWNATLGHPQIKANIAFALSRANPSKYSRLIYPELPAGYNPVKEIAKTGVYRYSPKEHYTKSKALDPLKTIKRPAEEATKIRKKSEIAREQEEAKRLKQLEKTFREMPTLGPPLIKPKEQYTKSKPVKILKKVDKRLRGLKYKRGE